IFWQSSLIHALAVKPLAAVSYRNENCTKKRQWDDFAILNFLATYALYATPSKNVSDKLGTQMTGRIAERKKEQRRSDAGSISWQNIKEEVASPKLLHALICSKFDFLSNHRRFRPTNQQ
uniref:Uncharacterized protein n=1 Tax=Romanomermis culicivorax TaxID=13658 RepID=A0A915I9H4_ROMCU